MSKRKRSKGTEPRQPAPSKCMDCGRTVVVPRYAYFRASRPRCPACGGLLEYQGSWFRTRSK